MHNGQVLENICITHWATHRPCPALWVSLGKCLCHTEPYKVGTVLHYGQEWGHIISTNDEYSS